MQEMVVSAPGKVIIHGEHAVVYGKRALAASLDLRTYLKLKVNTDTNCVSVTFPNINFTGSWNIIKLLEEFTFPLCLATNPVSPSAELLLRLKQAAGIDCDTIETRPLAVVAFLYLYFCICYNERGLPAVHVTLASSLPTGAGLGSSAAFATCLSASLLQHAGRVATPVSKGDGHVAEWNSADLDLINTWAFQAEKIIHGNPSGIDNSVSTYGGALIFQGGKLTPIKKMPRLRVLLLNTRVARSTKVMVAGVKVKLEKYPAIIRPVLESIEAITAQCEQVYQQMCDEGVTEEHYDVLGSLVEMNQHHLAVLGVSHPALEAACRASATQGLPAKLTGAGGGGCAFALIPPDAAADVVAVVSSEMKRLQFDCSETVVGGYGLLLHTKVGGGFTPPAELLT